MKHPRKRTWMGLIMTGAVLSTGCATVAGIASANGGEYSRRGHTPAYQQGPVYTVASSAFDYHSLSDNFGFRPSLGGPLGLAKPPLMPGPNDTPLAEVGPLGVFVKGLPGADIRRLGLSGYAGSWAEAGLGRSTEDMSHDPWPIFVYAELRILPFPDRQMIMR